MNNNTSAAEVFALYAQLGEQAFTELIASSDLSNARILELTAQVLNTPVIDDDQAQPIRTAVAQKGRQEVKNDLLNMGITAEDVEIAFRAAGV